MLILVFLFRVLSGWFVLHDSHNIPANSETNNRALFGKSGTIRCKSFIITVEKNQKRSRKDYERLEQVVGCKWSVSVLMAVKEGTDRPGALERAISGISTKILSERLRKLSDYGLLDKKKFNESPPRTVYALTSKGRKLVSIIAQLHTLDRNDSSQTDH